MSDMDALADQYLHYILVEKGLAKKTITAYSRDIVRYLAYLKKNRIRSIEKADTRIILDYLIHLKDQGLGTSSRARHLVTIRGFYTFLVQEKHIPKNHAKIVTLPKRHVALPDVLSVMMSETSWMHRFRQHRPVREMRQCSNSYTPPD